MMNTIHEEKSFPLRPWQPLMRAVDVVGLDVEAMVETAIADGVDCLIINAGGFLAFYPTELPFQRRNPYLESDFVGRIVSAAEGSGLQVYGRLDFSKGFPEWFEDNPDWFAVGPKGDPIGYWGMNQTCFTGPYVQDYSFRVLDELLSKYPLDGLFLNFYYLPQCYCPRCQQLVQAGTGYPVPAGSQLEPSYERWRHRQLAVHTERVRDRLRQHDPTARLMVYHHTHKGWDPRLIAKATDIWTAQISSPLLVNPLDPQPQWPRWPGEEARKGAALKPGVPSVLIQSYSEFFASRRVLQSGDRLIAQMIQAAAHGAAPCPALSGVPDQQEDPRPLRAVAAQQRKHAQLEKLLSNTVTNADIALIYSPDSFWFGPDQGRPAGAPYGHLAEFRGLYAALTDSRYPFDICMADTLNAATLSPYRVIILPSVHCLSDGDAMVIDQWVAEGGHLIATGDSGIADVDGIPRGQSPGAALEPLLGVGRNVDGAYLRIDTPSLQRAIGGATILGIAGNFWTLDSQGEQSDLNLLGPVSNNSPEFASWDDQMAESAGLVKKRCGMGFSFRLPWLLGGLYYRHAIPEYPLLIAELLRAVVGDPPIKTDAPHSVEIVLREQKVASGQRWLVHLINDTATVGGPRLATVQLPPITVRIRCDAKKAYLAVSERPVEVTRADGWVSVQTGPLRHHELVVLEP